jgi:hypothetical protein
MQVQWWNAIRTYVPREVASVTADIEYQPLGLQRKGKLAPSPSAWMVKRLKLAPRSAIYRPPGDGHLICRHWFEKAP